MKFLAAVLLGGLILIPWSIARNGDRAPQSAPLGVDEVAPPARAVEGEPAGDANFLVPPIRLNHVAGSSSATDRARAEPHGHEQCASGCAVSHHPTEQLDVERCRELLMQYQREPVDRASTPLDTLIYFGPQTRRLMHQDELGELLDEPHQVFLERELARDRLLLRIRVVDESGVVRIHLPPTSVPQHVRQVFSMDVHGLQPLVSSGTLKRVGLNHVWQRL